MVLAVQPEQRALMGAYTPASVRRLEQHYLHCVLPGIPCQARREDEALEGKPPPRPWPTGAFESFADVRADLWRAHTTLWSKSVAELLTLPDIHQNDVRTMPPEARALWVLIVRGPAMSRSQRQEESGLKQQPRSRFCNLPTNHACSIIRMSRRRMWDLQDEVIGQIATLLSGSVRLLDPNILHTS